MDLNVYQGQASRTLHDKLDSPELDLRLMAGLGVAEEAGEVAGIIKKHFFHGHGLDRTKLVEELGDVLWYVAAMATLMNVDLEAVAKDNIGKLRVRYPEGFSEEASIARADRPAQGTIKGTARVLREKLTKAEYAELLDFMGDDSTDLMLYKALREEP